MRTTIEIPDDQRAALLSLAAKRGEKGFSRLVQEALAMYLAAESERQDTINKALAAIGSLDAEAADRLSSSVRELQETWRCASPTPTS